MGSASRSLSAKALVIVALVLAIVPVILAHGDDEGMNMEMESSSGLDMTEALPQAINATTNSTTDGAAIVYKPTYFAHPEHAGLMYAHILLMTLAWIFALPVGKLDLKTYKNA